MLARSGRKSWSTVGRKTSPSLLAELSVMKSSVRERRVDMDRERRHVIISREVEVIFEGQPAANATADVALKEIL